MMRYIRYAILAVIGIVLISVALANREIVTLKLMPDALAELAGFNLSLPVPLFLVVLAGIAVGLVIGYIFEWLREHKHRRDAGQQHRQVRQLEREVNKLKKQKNEGKDDVLALLEEAN